MPKNPKTEPKKTVTKMVPKTQKPLSVLDEGDFDQSLDLPEFVEVEDSKKAGSTVTMKTPDSASSKAQARVNEIYGIEEEQEQEFYQYEHEEEVTLAQQASLEEIKTQLMSMHGSKEEMSLNTAGVLCVLYNRLIKNNERHVFNLFVNETLGMASSTCSNAMSLYRTLVSCNIPVKRVAKLGRNRISSFVTIFKKRTEEGSEEFNEHILFELETKGAPLVTVNEDGTTVSIPQMMSVSEAREYAKYLKSTNPSEVEDLKAPKLEASNLSTLTMKLYKDTQHSDFMHLMETIAGLLNVETEVKAGFELGQLVYKLAVAYVQQASCEGSLTPSDMIEMLEKQNPGKRVVFKDFTLEDEIRQGL